MKTQKKIKNENTKKRKKNKNIKNKKCKTLKMSEKGIYFPKGK